MPGRITMRVWADLHKTDVYVMTHVIEVRRPTGRTSPQPRQSHCSTPCTWGLVRARPVGRADAARGQDANSKVVWADWRPGFCDPAQATSSGWWYQSDQQALGEFLDARCRCSPIRAAGRRCGCR